MITTTVPRQFDPEPAFLPLGHSAWSRVGEGEGWSHSCPGADLVGAQRHYLSWSPVLPELGTKLALFEEPYLELYFTFSGVF